LLSFEKSFGALKYLPYVDDIARTVSSSSAMRILGDERR
jgi:hypothetical protein